MTRDEALRLRAIVEQAAVSLDNKTAFEARQLFPGNKAGWWDGHLVSTGTRLHWGGGLFAAMADLWAYPANNPDNAPDLWERIEYLDGYRVLLGPISTSNPVQPGEKCWEDGVLYQSIAKGANVYRPSEYMANWSKAGGQTE